MDYVYPVEDTQGDTGRLPVRGECASGKDISHFYHKARDKLLLIFEHSWLEVGSGSDEGV